MIKKCSAVTFGFFGMLLAATPVWAGEVDLSISKPPIVKIINPSQLIGSIIALILIISVVIAFVFLIWGGVQWIMSGGDKSGVEAAQHRIQAAILGLFIVFVGWAIFTIVGQFLGFSITDLKITTPF